MLSVTQNLSEREMNLNVHKAWVNEKECTATFPLYDLQGRLTGFQQYKPEKDKVRNNHPRDCKYFTYCNKNDLSLWGLESWNFSNTLFVTEGVFDACRLTNIGLSAVAVLSCDVSKAVKSTFKLVRKFRPVVVVCDNDGDNKAGLKLAKLGHLSYKVPNTGDLGDSPTYVLEQLKREYLL